ncbi:uncharacterized protein HD556DRAFT_845645 [Suillus plorans]|uniref:Uncharacterized protein n=1 Tax=Suillus plorans TaxID=116603 RepID=A0A9P7AG54_9AGAM|nr:uncharacterized protein HD556DRAFT_845645 [Suillus plorans]KAG1788764.1 hypothetical protein HD556DRAFT_845645 [Suillus plorans]
MLYSFNPKNLPFVGKGRRKTMSLTKARKEEQDLMEEIDPAALGIDELNSDKQSMDSDDTCMNSQPATSDSADCIFIHTALDGKSLPSHSFTSSMTISKGYANIKRTLKAVPRKPQRMHSRKMQHHFSQAYGSTNTSTKLSSASTTPNDSTGPVCYVGPSIDHDLSTKVKTHLHITEDDILAAVSEPSGHHTKCRVHAPDVDDGDPVPCKIFRCPRCCTGNHSVGDNGLNLNTTVLETRKTQNGQIMDSTGEEEIYSHKICRFPCDSTSAPSSNGKTSSVFNGEPERTDARFNNDVEEGTGIRKAYRPTQTLLGVSSSEAKVSPNATSFPLLAVVDSARLPVVPIEHLGPSTEKVASNSPFAACQVDEIHVALLSSLILPSTALHGCHSATNGPNLLANNGISSLTSTLPVPFMNCPSYEAAFNPYSLDFPNLPEQVLFAEQPVSTFSGPSLSATTNDRSTAGPFCSGPFISNSLDISSDHASFVNNGDVRANEGPLPQPQWVDYSDRIDVEMTDAAIKPTRPFLDFPPLDVTAMHYACTYEPPVAITVSGGASTYVSAVGPSSEEFSTNVEASYSQPVLDSTARYSPIDIGPSAIQSELSRISHWSSSILGTHSAVFSAPTREQPTDFPGSRYPCSGLSEISSAEQNVYGITAREQDIPRTAGKANPLGSTLENEEYAKHASSADLNVDVHEHAASQFIPASNTVIHAKTVVQPPGHFNDTITSVRRQPQYITPPAVSITGRCSDGKETQTDIDAMPEPDDDTKTEPDDDAKTEPDDGINEKDVNAEVLAHAILDIPLPPAIVASVQLLGQRKRRNSCCRKGITRMRVKRRQMTTEENEEGGNGGIRAHRTRLNHLSRPSPYASVPWRRKGHSKGLRRWYCSSGLHSQANVPSDEISQTSAVVSADNSLSCSPFILRDWTRVHSSSRSPASYPCPHTFTTSVARQIFSS